jgi:hypothetical protein
MTLRNFEKINWHIGLVQSVNYHFYLMEMQLVLVML